MPIRVGNKAEGRDFFDRVREREEIWRWYKRLERDLSQPELGFALDCLSAIARSKQGLTRRQLLNRLQKRESDPDRRARLLDGVLLKLEEDGYLGLQQERVRFSSFLLRDYWRRNHA